MKNVLSILGHILLFAVFVAIFFGGGVLGLFHLDPFQGTHWFVSHPTPTSVRYFIPTGLLLMTMLWLVVMGLEAMAHRLRSAGRWTTLVYVLALIVGIAAKFGFVQNDGF